MDVEKEGIYNKLIKIAQSLAERKKGGLFVIAPKYQVRGEFECLYPQLVGPYSIHAKGATAVLEKLCELDGACILSDDGEILAYGARIRKSIPVPGYGTKHAAASGITNLLKESTAILISEESGWIKIFKGGKVVVEMDSKKAPASLMQKVVSFLTDNDTALLTAAGTSAALVGFLPVVVVSGTYLAIKTASGMIKKGLNA